MFKYVKSDDMRITVEDSTNFIYWLYLTLRSFIQNILEATIVKANPELAAKFADTITMLVTLASIRLMLELATLAKKIIRAIIIIGLVLLIISLLASPKTI